MENCKLMRYEMGRINEDELECLRKLGDHHHRQQQQQRTTSYRKAEVVKSCKIECDIDYNVVRLDEDELECLRKLGEHSSNTTTSQHKGRIRHQMLTGNNNHKMVRIDEDELECLLRLDEATTTTTTTNNNDNVIGEVLMKKKLESKKSEDINESAEKFIQSFKKQLLLQRLESIESAEQMLARGL